MRLKITHPDGEEQFVQLQPDQPLRLGTHRAADVVLRGAGVFPVHFGVKCRQGTYQAVASKSSKTIRINGKKVPSAPLKVGDRIDAGQTRIVIVEDQIESGQEVAGELEDSPNADLGMEAELAPLDEALDMLADGALDDDVGPLDDPRPLSGEPGSRGHRVAERADRAERGPSVVGRVVRSGWFRAGLAALVFIPLAAAFWFYYQQLPTAKERFDLADRLYRDGQLAESAEAFDSFVVWNRRSEWGAEARVKRDVARLKLAAERGEDPAALLARTEQVTEQWDSIVELPAAQSGLADILPGIVLEQLNQGTSAMEGNAKEAASNAFADAARALALIDRCVPPKMQRSQNVDQLKCRLAIRQRDLNQNDVVRKTLEDIEQAGKQGGIAACYAPLDQLLTKYPELAVSGRIRSVFRKLALAESDRVVLRKVDNQPLTQSPPSAASPQGSEPVRTSTDSVGIVPVFARLLGMLYGLDAANGKVRWQSSIGLGTDVLPVPVTDQPASDIVLVQPATERVTRVDVQTGKPRWRVAVGPVVRLSQVVGREIIAATGDRRLVALDVATGTPQWQLQLPQQPVDLVVDRKSERCYVVADRGVVYVISLPRKCCLSVYYMGHAYKAVAIHPIVFHDQLLVIERTGPSSSHLHLLAGSSSLATTQVLALPAFITSLHVAGQHVFLAGADGKLYLLRWDSTRRREPLKIDHAVPMIDERTWNGQLVFMTFRAGTLWTSGQGVMRWQVTSDDAVPTKKGRLAPTMLVAQPMILAGSDLICVGRKPANAGLMVQAWNAEDGDLHWSSIVLPRAVTAESDESAGEGSVQ